MDISIRLKTIASMVDKCEVLVDVGTDHAYIPIYLVENHICQRAIASDINKGPVEKAKLNVAMEGLKEKIQCRLGGGFSTIEPAEADVAVIAGMGGNLIRDIILEREEVFKNLQYAVLQPVQNPEVLREFIYKKGYEILDEELCLEDEKYYQIMKVKFNNKPINIKDIYYEVGQKLIEKKHPLLKNFLMHLVNKYKRILNSIKDDTDLAKKRKIEISHKLKELEELISCL
ncbi:tRNA (adenine(22)-N(1))-methyltransferase [Haloimpatiens massiliensis]|uniref:tRNA (adenine(22)-N(1))-methyltransferase n=1 Tax=Haloimpatiens massiliensis TaxID=1658110 RepID=UPI000C85BCB4|nr:class I SAM-dependent methyltransferase [Haloimpatiens massiliensis]